MKRIAHYKNGNYFVDLYEDGTKVRYNDLDNLTPEFVESMDCKITNQCPFGCPMCFPRGTKILMSDYNYKNIEDVAVGDEVFGFETIIDGNRNNSRIMPTKVLKTFEHVEEELLEIKTTNASVICTPNHPIYTKQRRKNGRLFRRADALRTGDKIFLHYNKIKSYFLDEIIEINKITKMQNVYNFETSCHTYIANNILVHNCHEKSTPNGKHGDIMNAEFINKLRKGTEMAIGGGAVTSHPDLVPFLKKLKKIGVIPSITVNQREFKDNFELIDMLVKEKLIYGLGISFNSFDDDFWDKIIKNNPNVVVHLIAGIHGGDVFDYFANKNAKILILGYKDFGRGHELLEKANVLISTQLNWLKNNLKNYMSKFRVISFDNLAIEQLDIKNLLNKEQWDNFYQGDDGSHTMYVDLVNEQFAKTSTSNKRYPLLSNIDDMFKIIKGEEKNEK